MNPTDICYLQAHEIVNFVKSGKLSAVEVAKAHISRIESVNPKVNAIVTFLPELALETAQAIDNRIKRGDRSGSLLGLPVVHKDLFDTKGIRTTYGSPIYKDNVPTHNSIIVDRLQAAGAVTIGKSNTPEFGAGSQTFNEVFGATLNPHDLSKTCGGSSGGAAVALACGMTPLADGSDLGGSLRNPASFCNVVGLRPSSGFVPDWPRSWAWSSFSVSGPMARTVPDLSLMLSAIGGEDRRDPISYPINASRYETLEELDCRGIRVAWSPDLGGLPIEKEVLDNINASRKVFEDLGCVVEDACIDFSDADEIFQVMRSWLYRLKYAELLKTNRKDLKDTVVWQIESGLKLSSEDLAHAELKRTKLFDRVSEFFDSYDFFVGPAVQVLPFDVTKPYVSEIEGVAMETYIDWMKACYWITATGCPAISVPCGFSKEGLPVGLQIVGRFRDDYKLLQLSAAFEQFTKKWTINRELYT